MKITPTVGRVVYFNLNTVAAPGNFSIPVAGEPLAAIIAAVLADGALNLSVIDASGWPHSFMGVQLVQEGEDPPATDCFAYWMPYQLAQAGIKPLAPSIPADRAPALERAEAVKQLEVDGYEPHQVRVFEEHWDLKEKISKLDAFRKTPWFQNLFAAEQGRLTRQQEAMQAYSDVLAERIAAFPKAAA